VGWRFVQGDATRAESWAKALGGVKAEALLTDPPYCLLTRRRKGGDLRDAKDRKIERGPLRRFETVREYREFTRAWLELAARHLVPQAPMVIWTNLLGREPITSVAKELGWSAFAGEYVWGKRTREGNSGEEILRVVETALVFTREPRPEPAPGDAAIPWAVVAGYDDEGEAAKFGSHPNAKPFKVIEPLVRCWTRPGQHVVDPFGGSGAIPAALVRLGREAHGIELETEWAERVRGRLTELGAEAA
jgi:site-specific DNA-methyltransferase (adenine-specific)